MKQQLKKHWKIQKKINTRIIVDAYDHPSRRKNKRKCNLKLNAKHKETRVWPTAEKTI